MNEMNNLIFHCHEKPYNGKKTKRLGRKMEEAPIQ